MSSIADGLGSKTLVVYFVVFSLVFLGCGAPVTRRLESPPAFTASPSHARVVFILPGRAGAGGQNAVTLWDSQNLIGRFGPNNVLVTDMAPGRHRLVALCTNSDVVEANFTAGKTYYIYLWTTYTGFTTTVHINPLPPGSKHWNDKDRWISRSRYIELIPQNTQQYTQRYGEEVRKALVEFNPSGPNSQRAILSEYGI